MLENLDVLIGVSVIMLGLSLIVTIAGQLASNAFALRKTNLRWGLSVLVQQLHREKFPPPENKVLFERDLNANAVKLVSEVLAFPLVSDSKIPLWRWKLASVIRFDEFSKTVGLLGSSNASADLKWLSENTRITEPWFNSVMDRVSQRFAAHMRIYTIVLSALLVLITGVDTLHVLRTLRTDVSIRSGLVAAAQSIAKNDAPGSADAQKVQAYAQSVIGQLPQDQGILTLLRPSWPPPAGDLPSRLPGLLLSAGLLSLGAPFWFNTLKNLSALRPAIAGKEEKDRLSASLPDVGDRITVRNV